MRGCAIKAIGGDMRAAERFLQACRGAGLLEVTAPEDEHQYDYRVPKEWVTDDWVSMYEQFGPPPWRGERDGLIPLERWKAHYGRRPRTR